MQLAPTSSTVNKHARKDEGMLNSVQQSRTRSRSQLARSSSALAAAVSMRFLLGRLDHWYVCTRIYVCMYAHHPHTRTHPSQHHPPDTAQHAPPLLPLLPLLQQLPLRLPQLLRRLRQPRPERGAFLQQPRLVVALGPEGLGELLQLFPFRCKNVGCVRG